MMHELGLNNMLYVDYKNDATLRFESKNKTSYLDI